MHVEARLTDLGEGECTELVADGGLAAGPCEGPTADTADVAQELLLRHLPARRQRCTKLLVRAPQLSLLLADLRAWAGVIHASRAAP
jgi:hypothetical protein